VTDAITRHVVATGTKAAEVAAKIVDHLAGPGLRLALVFADWRFDPVTIARATSRGLQAPVVGGTTVGVIGRGTPLHATSAIGIGFYGDWCRIGIGVAPGLPTSALTRSRDAVHRAVAALGLTVDTLDPARHVAITLFDGTCGHEEAFCIGSAAAAPGIRFVGGSTATGIGNGHGTRALTWVNGEVMSDAGTVIVLESELPFVVVTSAHLVPTDVRTVVTGAAGRVIHELDGRPAVPRLRDLISQLGDTLDEPHPSHSLARYVDGVPYVRSIVLVERDLIHVASAVEPGHVLRVMRPGDLIGTTTRDLSSARDRVGGEMAALLAFSCLGRHSEAAARKLERELAGVYEAYPTAGFQTLGEQSGMLLVNHTLTGLAIGAPRSDR
jgi:hypothetical protein